MRVFLAGATGAIGRPLIARLVAAGHHVTCLSRTEDKARDLRARGAEAAIADVYDPAGLEKAVVAARPEAVLHELTALPRRIDPLHLGRDYQGTIRLRTEGMRNLGAAARAAGVKRFVSQSISFAVVPDPGPADETRPLWVDASRAAGAMYRATADLERQTLEFPEGIVLRYGTFYGPGTYYSKSEGSIAAEVRKGKMPMVGEGKGVASFIHIDDAAAATVAAIERGQPGIYNIVDDDPSPMREWLPALAKLVDGPPPKSVPGWLVRMVIGDGAAALALSAPPSTNDKAKRDLGWKPTHIWRTELADG